jgi:hypothetical protein
MIDGAYDLTAFFSLRLVKISLLFLMWSLPLGLGRYWLIHSNTSQYSLSHLYRWMEFSASRWAEGHVASLALVSAAFFASVFFVTVYLRARLCGLRFVENDNH